MSHKPDGPVEQEARRHRPAIIGIALALLVAAIAFFIFGSDTSDVTELSEAPGGTVEGAGDPAAVETVPAGGSTDAPAD